MNTIKTNIIPTSQTFSEVSGEQGLDLKAICVFCAIGFFLDEDTFWKHKVVLRAASEHTINDEGVRENSKPWFNWYYDPKDLSFNEALDGFTDLFETIVKEQTAGKKVILPLSGGLDSRTQAAALHHIKADVFSYSYKFANGFDEVNIASEIAEKCGFDFKDYTIEPGYLWNKIDQLGNLNGYYSSLTVPRQMAIYDEYKTMGDTFSLGHWGDVLFDSMNVPEDMPQEEQIDLLIKKLIKRGGQQLAEDLWKGWQLEGNFMDYFRSRVSNLLKSIKIDNANSRLRAFKSLYWAPRWTSINLSVFEAHHPIALPYYDNRMCNFICNIPEDYLKDRQLQIAYIKKRSKELASIVWQDKRPFNLNNFENGNKLAHFSYRLKSKLKRSLNEVLGKPHIQRNWELQFLGKDNEQMLYQNLTNANFTSWIPKSIIEGKLSEFYKGDRLYNAHQVDMLLVLSKFWSQHGG
ncbi:asparagine synthase-related protein [Winogradskyella sp. 3972H.M.0a.05]|uniref:asparagine synthase-related protein n=1 Tax=Winogradskyella sp. 3972H.M.0a.05 TaxID=2950277 RepID=UPI0033943DEE